MKSLDILTENFWKNLYCSNVRYRLFVKDMVQRITLANVPVLTALLTDTNPIIGLYSDQIDLRDTNMQAQKVSTFLKNQVLEEYQVQIRGLAGAVIDVFIGKKSMQYSVEFFPHNIEEYSDMTEFTAEALFTRTATLTTKYETELGTPRQVKFANMASTYDSSHQTQQLAKAAVETSNTAIKKKVKDVKDITFRNILSVAAYYYLTPEVVKTFYKETYLHCRHKTQQGVPIEAAYKKDIHKGTILLADFSYLSTESVLFENQGKDSLYYFSSDTELINPIVPIDAIELISGEELVVAASTLKKYLYIANKSTLAMGKIQLSLI